jgi:hypothetical protein
VSLDLIRSVATDVPTTPPFPGDESFLVPNRADRSAVDHLLHAGVVALTDDANVYCGSFQPGQLLARQN